MIEVFFDVETKKLFHEVEGRDTAKLGVSIVSVYSREIDTHGKEIRGGMKSYWEKDFPKLWKVLHDADRIVGFNSLNFDSVALQPYAPFQLAKLTHLDIMDEVKKTLGHRLSLNALATQTLGSVKSDVGTNAVIYFAKGDPESLEKLRTYCEADVAITRDLYDFGVQHKHLKYLDRWNTPRIVEVDFSYPKATTDTGKQTSLF
ncbi:MAG TPA: ribonuclease H-like domain-containing protein [Candidatus Levybacteria bacterium]|nr:ribonuclease H-like domain-containing protein [Candidatus Levybacteria bacterium]